MVKLSFHTKINQTTQEKGHGRDDFGFGQEKLRSSQAAAQAKNNLTMEFLK